MSSSTALLILAAGKGTRLRSALPKALHEAGGASLLEHVLRAGAAAGIAPNDTIVVAGYAADRVRAAVAPRHVRVVAQEPQLGTGHAVMAARELWRPYASVAVIHGDMPLVSAATIRGVIATLERERAEAALATATPASPRAYGRIVRQDGRIVGIVEERQASPEQKQIRELNAGFYAFRSAPLAAALERIGTDNPHREYYLTDAIALLAQSGLCASYALADADEILGINDRAELAEVDRLMRRRKVWSLMEQGVTVYLPETVGVDLGVEVGADTVLEPGVQMRGQTRIGQGCRIQAYSVIIDCTLADGVTVKPHCVLEAASLESGVQVGPFTRLREGAQIAAGAHIGNFVEVKKSRVGRGTKAMHLAYLGDAQVGANVNIGAGTITCNYDGVEKHPTAIGDGTFVGSNSTLVAPLEIGAGAYIGAGSVITDPVPPEALALGRGRQVNKEGWVARRKAKAPKKKTRE